VLGRVAASIASYGRVGELGGFLAISHDRSVSLRSTGWLQRADVLTELSNSDIFVMTFLWEGVSFSLFGSQGGGPVPDIVGCRDMV
jgi:hypothetical protein